MKIIYNNILPPKGFTAINIFGILFARKGAAISEKTINHEQIHTAQMRELLYVPFYVLYFLEWLIKLIFYGGGAYRNLSFEREAYDNDDNLGYLGGRKCYAWVKQIFKA